MEAAVECSPRPAVALGVGGGERKPQEGGPMGARKGSRPPGCQDRSCAGGFWRWDSVAWRSSCFASGPFWMASGPFAVARGHPTSTIGSVPLPCLCHAGLRGCTPLVPHLFCPLISGAVPWCVSLPWPALAPLHCPLTPSACQCFHVLDQEEPLCPQRATPAVCSSECAQVTRWLPCLYRHPLGVWKWGCHGCPRCDQLVSLALLLAHQALEEGLPIRTLGQHAESLMDWAWGILRPRSGRSGFPGLGWLPSPFLTLWGFTATALHQAPCAHLGFPGGTVEKNQPANAGSCKRGKFDPWVGEVPWRRKWQPPPVFLPGKSLGQRSLAGCSPWGHRVWEVDMTEYVHIYTWEKRESQLQLNCFVKNFVIGFPEMPPLVADLVEGGPRLHRRVEKVAPVSGSTLTGWPLLVRVTWGSCVVMRTEAKVGSPGPRESWSCIWVSDPWNLHPWGY